MDTRLQLWDDAAMSFHRKCIKAPTPVEYVPEGHEAQTADFVAPARDMESAR